MAELRETIAATELVIKDLCNGGRWRMSVPPRKDDPDLVISDLVERARQAADLLDAEGCQDTNHNFVAVVTGMPGATYMTIFCTKCGTSRKIEL